MPELSTISPISHISFSVRDADKTAAWWQEVFGFHGLVPLPLGDGLGLGDGFLGLHRELVESHLSLSLACASTCRAISCRRSDTSSNSRNSVLIGATASSTLPRTSRSGLSGGSCCSRPTV